MTQTLTVELPSTLYQRLKKRAEQADHSVEEELLDVLETSVPAGDELSSELRQALASMELLEDRALESAARSRLAREISAELEALHLKRQREGLTDAETGRCEELIRAYENAMLIRAQAAALLKKRGIDVAHLVALP
jgi:hypothetical protein